jgi:hypothetical protein
VLTLASAQVIAEAVLRKGHGLGLGPLTAAVLAAGLQPWVDGDRPPP